MSTNKEKGCAVSPARGVGGSCGARTNRGDTWQLVVTRGVDSFAGRPGKFLELGSGSSRGGTGRAKLSCCAGTIGRLLSSNFPSRTRATRRDWDGRTFSLVTVAVAAYHASGCGRPPSDPGATLPAEQSFVPNSVDLCADPDSARGAGPNMGGKSCFIRQVALISIMAQCGSFVPAVSAELSVMDGVYTRMGAADNLALGASTFLEDVGMRRHPRRHAAVLVVLDELGRGTSTHDGVAVAHATLDHLVANTRCLTLFVTHYPSVARELRAKHPKHCAAAYTSYVEAGGGDDSGKMPKEEREKMEEEEEEEVNEGEHIEFMYKLTPGVAHRSFGLNVARMAGLPPSVLRRAGVKAKELEIVTARRSTIRTMGSAADVAAAAAAAENPARRVLRAIDDAAVATGAAPRREHASSPSASPRSNEIIASRLE